MEKSASKRSRPLATSLSITLNGPFVYDFGHIAKDAAVDVYAPYCPYHVAGVFYSLNSLSEVDLWKCAQSQKPKEKLNRFYGVTITKLKPNYRKPKVIAPKYPKGFSSVALSQTIKKTADSGPLSPPKDKILFKITVPNPTYIYPLYFDRVEIVESFAGNPDNSKIAPHCTGFRFFYPWNAHSPVKLVIPSGNIFNIEPPVFAEVPMGGDIEFRYEGLGLADENDPHSDARSCFASMSVLAGVEWWLNYGDCKSSPTNPSHGSSSEVPAPQPCSGMSAGGMTIEYHTGGDCHAAAIVSGLG